MNATPATSNGPIPRKPTARPETTEFSAKPMPCTMPTRPFAFGRSSAGTSIVTQVARARPRIDSTSAPSSRIVRKTQKNGRRRSRSTSEGITKKSADPIAKATAVQAVASIMAVFLRMRSMSVPKGTLVSARKSM